MANGAWREGKLIGGYEYDALCKQSRRIHLFRAGMVKGLKRGFWRRIRRLMRIKLNGFDKHE